MSPTIKGNTFENITSNLPLVCFILNTDIASIFIDNNTFCGFQMNNEFGGIGLNISNINHDVTIEVTFNNCYFINNSNSEGKNQEGAISFSNFQNLGNVKLSVTNCFFENNHKEDKGSSIYANIQHEIIIEYSTFKGDKCSAKGCVFIQPDYEGYNEGSSITISNCNFERIEANFYSIYISEGSNKTLSIQTCSFDTDKGCVCIEKFNNKIEILGNYFINTTEKSALFIQQSSNSIYNNEITINECFFISCKGIDNKCFDISTYTYGLVFKNNVIQNTKGTGCNSHFGTINCNNKMITFEVRNISFNYNLCDSLYGGGSGIKFIGMNQLTFVDCRFVGNGAVQNFDFERPTQISKKPYYNGDGGGIQLGYICSTNNYNVLFKECSFINNHAQRHGGAIAIQTTGIVEIISCIFEKNEANYNFNNGSELLIENHFDKKFEGRGGAIYINPSYTYEDSSNECQSPTSFLSQIKIEKNTFIKNNCYDGYGIYYLF